MEDLTASFSEHFAPLEVTGVDDDLTGTTLGRGSYATVQEVEWHGTQCAAKVLHEILLKDHSSGGAQRFVASFKKECLMWSKLSHPHIVQFLGVYFRRGSSIPILLMEKMDTSLRCHLEENQRNHLALADKVFMLLQVVQGLAYLHSRKPALVHHDLSPNNILLNREVLQVKLTDFGMSRAVDPSGASRKSSVKGTRAFMSPEALVEPPHYDEKLDVFSFGNVIITTLTHAWPNPGAFNKYRKDRLVALSEFERREQYIILFSPKERAAFIAVIRSCLENRPNLRPTSLQLVGQMKQIEKDHPRKKLVAEGPAVIEKLHAQLQTKDAQLQAKHTQLQEKDTLVTQLLEENERLQQENNLLRRTHQKPSSAEKPASSSSPTKPFKPDIIKGFRSDLVIPWPGEHRSVKMPDLLIPTYCATPVIIGRNVYLAGGVTDDVKTEKLVQVYNMDSGDCRTLPPSPQYRSAAVAIDGTLVLIGGRSSSTGMFTNMVSTWMAAEERWTQNLPPMRIKKPRPGVLLLNNHLFVFRGTGENGTTLLDSYGLDLEVLNLHTKQWREGCKWRLPRPLSSLQLGVFRDSIMLYGGYTSEGMVTIACYTISVQVLVDSVTNSGWSHSTPVHWTPVQRAPYSRSALLTTRQDAVLIGGQRDHQATRAIQRFSSSGSWEVISNLPEPRLLPTVVAVSDWSFLVLGGYSDPNNPQPSGLKSVELMTDFI